MKYPKIAAIQNFMNIFVDEHFGALKSNCAILSDECPTPPRGVYKPSLRGGKISNLPPLG